jgi:adenosylmethionine-8-amino-7-oxononanoate aminotransferase
MTRSPVWHPFTQHALEPPIKRIVATEGAYLIDEHGNRILDAISSWWVITHGHRHPAIMQAIRTATEPTTRSSSPNIRMRPPNSLPRPVEIAPAGLRMCSTRTAARPAVEVALKMALGYFHNRTASRATGSW